MPPKRNPHSKAATSATRPAIFSEPLARDWLLAHQDETPITPYMSELAMIKFEMGRLQGEFERLGKEREKLRREYSILAWKIAPVRRLPFELLGKIFRVVVDTSKSNFNASGPLVAIFSHAPNGGMSRSRPQNFGQEFTSWATPPNSKSTGPCPEQSDRSSIHETTLSTCDSFCTTSKKLK